MGKLADRIEGFKQHHHANRLRSTAVREYANDPDVVFHDHPQATTDAPHGVNTSEEMTYSVESVAD